jgi:hypothetical protein
MNNFQLPIFFLPDRKFCRFLARQDYCPLGKDSLRNNPFYPPFLQNFEPNELDKFYKIMHLMATNAVVPFYFFNFVLVN